MKDQTNQKKFTNEEMITQIFDNAVSAEKALKVLESHGYTKDEINILMSDITHEKYLRQGYQSLETENKALKGVGTGSVIGITLGAIIGGLAAVGSVLIPGVGLIVAGPLAAAFAGAGAGSIAGGVIGALVGWGIPESSAKKYEQAIKEGKIVIGVYPHSSEDAELIKREWNIFKEEPVLA